MSHIENDGKQSTLATLSLWGMGFVFLLLGYQLLEEVGDVDQVSGRARGRSASAQNDGVWTKFVIPATGTLTLIGAVPGYAPCRESAPVLLKLSDGREFESGPEIENNVGSTPFGTTFSYQSKTGHSVVMECANMRLATEREIYNAEAKYYEQKRKEAERAANEERKALEAANRDAERQRHEAERKRNEDLRRQALIERCKTKPIGQLEEFQQMMECGLR